MNTNFARLLLVVVATLLSSHASAAEFYGLGILPGGGSSGASQANAVSADGSVVVGTSDSAIGQQAFRWTVGGGLTPLGYLGGTPTSYASSGAGVSANGSVIVGGALDNDNQEAYRRPDPGPMTSLNTSTYSEAFGVSADGTTVVGRGWLPARVNTQAFRWTAADGMRGLGYLFGAVGGVSPESVATATSSNGAIVVGYSGNAVSYDQAFRWSAADGMVGLGALATVEGGLSSFARAVSADGSVIVGNSVGLNGDEAFRWTTGGMVSLGDLPGGTFWSRAYGVSADGGTVVGFGNSAQGQQAVVWTAGGDLFQLADLLTAQGVDLTGWNLGIAFGISADGHTIVGQGTHLGHQEAFVATLNVVPIPPAVFLLPSALGLLGWMKRKPSTLS